MDVTLRFKTEDKALVESLVTAWLEDEGVTIRHAAGEASVDLTYVKERAK